MTARFRRQRQLCRDRGPDRCGQCRGDARAPASGQGRTRHRQDGTGPAGPPVRWACRSSNGTSSPPRARSRGCTNTTPSSRLREQPVGRRTGQRRAQTTSARASCGRPFIRALKPAKMPSLLTRRDRQGGDIRVSQSVLCFAGCLDRDGYSFGLRDLGRDGPLSVLFVCLSSSSHLRTYEYRTARRLPAPLLFSTTSDFPDMDCDGSESSRCIPSPRHQIRASDHVELTADSDEIPRSEGV